MFTKAILSSPISGDILRIAIRQLPDQKYQVSYFDQKQVKHKNVSAIRAQELLEELKSNFRQVQIYEEDEMIQILTSKKGKQTTLRKALKEKEQIKPHNRLKNYLLEEDTPHPFLIELGIQNQDGSIKRDRRDKFVQINQYLRLVEPLLTHLKKGSHILDLACGRGYLTFGLDYLVNGLKKMDIKIVGVDNQKKFIDELNKITTGNLSFCSGDISTYEPETLPDMVISLHACNKATDLVLCKAISWKAKVILAVPCCHQEGLKSIKSDSLKALLKHGVIKERLSALATDAVRSEILQTVGYQADIIEFIPTEHTPKNLMIKAVYTGKTKSDRDLKNLLEALSLDLEICRDLRAQITD